MFEWLRRGWAVRGSFRRRGHELPNGDQHGIPRGTPRHACRDAAVTGRADRPREVRATPHRRQVFARFSAGVPCQMPAAMGAAAGLSAGTDPCSARRPIAGTIAPDVAGHLFPNAAFASGTQGAMRCWAADQQARRKAARESAPGAASRLSKRSFRQPTGMASLSRSPRGHQPSHRTPDRAPPGPKHAISGVSAQNEKSRPEGRLQMADFSGLRWLRGLDLNQRPSGYEPDELPGCSTPRHRRDGDRERDTPQKAKTRRAGLARRVLRF